jgi:hypothetical protein
MAESPHAKMQPVSRLHRIRWPRITDLDKEAVASY